MQNFLIFLPDFDVKKYPVTFYGIVVGYESGIAVYILGKCCSCHCKYSSRFEILGEINRNGTIENEKIESNFWISIQLSNNDSRVERVSIHTKANPRCVTVIMYNKEDIKKSQLLYNSYKNVELEQTDYIFGLIREVQNEPVLCCMKRKVLRGRNLSYFLILKKLYDTLQYLLLIIQTNFVAHVFRISSFGSHFLNILETFTNLLNQKLKDKYLNVIYANYLLARICDALLGEIIIYYAMSYISSDELFVGLIHVQEFVVTYLKNTVEWLMGSPAGFKLYCPLNNILGAFFQFHISLWWTFLKLLNPFFKFTFKFFLFLGNFGFSLQVSLLVDLLAVVSVHMYCIYVYAARLFYFQMKGLKILSRLFIGKKRSPLQGDVHSSPYTTEQLLFGTVSFTILLFLLPTTLIYYAVFTVSRIILIFVGGLLTRVKYFMNIFPLYLTFLWFCNPKMLTCTVRLNMKTACFPDGTLVTQVKPVCETWWKTVNLCVPKTVKRPNKIEWKKLTTDVLIGNLIYPV